MVSNVFVEKPLRDIAQGKYLNINLKLLDVREPANVTVIVLFHIATIEIYIYFKNANFKQSDAKIPNLHVKC